MSRPFRWSLQWQILAAILLVLSVSSWLYIWISDNLLLAGFDRQLTQRLTLIARLAQHEPGFGRCLAYQPGDESSRVYAGDRERLAAFARAQDLERLTFLGADSRVRTDSGGLLPGQASGFESGTGQEPEQTLLHRDRDGRWRKVVLWPLAGGHWLRLSAGSDMFSVLDRIQTRRWLALAVGVLLSLGLSWILARLLGYRLARLSAAFQRLRSGRRHIPLRVAGQDEIAFLSRAFNDMASDLHARAEREQSEHDRRVGELKILAGGVAHEIRNPLGAIAGLADLLLRSEALKSSPDALDLVQRLRGEVERVDRIVQDVMAYARQPQLQRAPQNLQILFAEAATADPGCTVEALPVPAPEPRVDRAGLLTVLRNLLLNAREAAGPRGEVRLGARCRPGRLLLYVADSGPGVPPDKARLIFQPFFSSKSRGTGLGLAIARNIVEAHGGRLRLAPAVRGAVFVVSLPFLEERCDGTNINR